MSKGIQAEGKCKDCGKRYKWDSHAKCFHCGCEPLKTAPRYTIYVQHKGELIRRGTTLEGETLREHWEAQALLKRANDEIRARKFDPETWKSKRAINYRLDKLLAEWFKEKSRKDLSPGVVRELQVYIGKYNAFWKDTDARDIQTAKDFYYQLTGSASYRKNIMMYLKNFFAWAINERKIAMLPRWPDIDPVMAHEPVTVSREIQGQFMQHIAEHHRPIFHYMVLQGCRPSEARALKWDCIDIDNMTVTYRRSFSENKLRERTKTNRIIHNPLFPETLRILPVRSFPDTFVFMNGNRPYSLQALQRAFSSARTSFNAATGSILKIEMYEFVKHSFGTQRVNEGVAIDVLQKWWGHSRRETSERYARLSVVDYLRDNITPFTEKTLKDKGHKKSKG